MAVHIGGVGSDTINAATLGENDQSNNYSGAEGNDFLYGGYLADSLNGGADDDYLFGRDGADYLYDDGGDNHVYGETGDDIITDYGLNCTLSGGSGDDQITSAYGSDYITGDAGDDYISASQIASGTIYGGGGEDTIYVYGDNYFVNGDAGDDEISFDGGNCSLHGGIGDDVFSGPNMNNARSSAAADGPAALIYGEAGDDFLSASTYLETFDGGAGEDGVSYDASAEAVRVNLRTNVNTGGSAQGDSLRFVEDVFGSDYNDVLVGDGRINWLSGGIGDDTVNGGVGGDVLWGDVGSDTLNYAGSSAGVTVNLLTGAASGGDAEGDTFQEFENLSGSSHNDALTGDAIGNRLLGQEGNDTLDGGTGADSMAGGVGNDTYLVDDAGDQVTEAAGAGTDTVRSSIAYTLGANVENLVLTGSANVNGVGNTLANHLTGNAGSNQLNGGAGADTMTGGGGADYFLFGSALGAGNVDRIIDFTVVDDTIRLDDSVFTGLAVGPLAAGAFYIGAAAHDASDRIIYNSTTRALFFDRDGTGGTYAAVQFATLGTGLALTNGDFSIV